MSGRIFQNVVLQLKDNTDRTIGVIDSEGVIIACSDGRNMFRLLMELLVPCSARMERPLSP